MVRSGKQRIALFVEGDTEQNYFRSLRKYKNVELIFKPVNMGGGGYKSFLEKIRKESTKTYIAFFIIIDLDKVEEDRENFNSLLRFCKLQNKKKNEIPFFIIGNNKDFEFFACCHCPKYTISKDTKTYIEKDFKYRDLSKFKSDDKIYEFLNKDGRSYINALNILKSKKSYIENLYTVNKKSLDINIKIKSTDINEHCLNGKNSNIGELFDIILGNYKQ